MLVAQVRGRMTADSVAPVKSSSAVHTFPPLPFPRLVSSLFLFPPLHLFSFPFRSSPPPLPPSSLPPFLPPPPHSFNGPFCDESIGHDTSARDLHCSHRSVRVVADHSPAVCCRPLHLPRNQDIHKPDPHLDHTGEQTAAILVLVCCCCCCCCSCCL